MVAWCAVLAVALQGAQAFYLPGMAPTDYSPGDEVPLLVNRLSSDAQNSSSPASGSLFSYDFYDPRFKFCRPKDGPKPKTSSLGSVLFGDRLYTSPITLKAMEDLNCTKICTATYTPEDLEFMKSIVHHNYVHSWLVDSLPVAGPSDLQPNTFPVGEQEYDYESDTYLDSMILYNTFSFIIFYHRASNNKVRVVGVYVNPMSESKESSGHPGCYPKFHSPIVFTNDEYKKDGLTVHYAYSVKWVYSDTPWATRWDNYLEVWQPKVNWFALINLMATVLVLVAFLALGLVRVVRKDIANYNQTDLDDEVLEDMGWKLLHGDVFRPPRFVMAYSIALGTGMQLLATIVSTLTLAMLGFLSPAIRGAFTTALVVSNALYGIIGGYASTYVFKLWKGKLFKFNLILTPLVVPAVIFALFIVLNFVLVVVGASGAVPFTNILAVVLIWLLIGVPTSVFAGFVALRKPALEPPARPNQIPRQIPRKPWYLQTPALMAVTGFVPFTAISFQLYYILSAIWAEKFYYMFGFLFIYIVSLILFSMVITCIVLYITLNREDYNWQWRSLCVGGSPALYLFLYSFYYMVRYLHLSSFSGKAIYLLYCLACSMLCFLGLGAAGAFAAHVLVYYVYSCFKVD